MAQGSSIGDPIPSLLAAMGLKLAFGIAFYFATDEQPLVFRAAPFAFLLLLVVIDISTHLRQRHQHTRFGSLPLRLDTPIVRLGAELAGSFEVAVDPELIAEAWVDLSCKHIVPAQGDFDQQETQLWSRRIAAKPEGHGQLTTVTFALELPRELPRSTYTPGMKIRDHNAEFDEWRVTLELSTTDGDKAQQSSVITVFPT